MLLSEQQTAQITHEHGGRSQLQNFNNFPTEFRKLAHGIWQNFPQKTVGPSYKSKVQSLEVRLRGGI